MLEFLKKEANKTYTENGAVTYRTTKSDVLDLFATIGALRRDPETEINTRFDRAWAENPDLTMKTLFYARDIRGGLGERRVFRIILKHMAQSRMESIQKNLWAVPVFGRFDDLLPLLDTQAQKLVLGYLKAQFNTDLLALKNDETISLLGKWLPSINAHKADTVRYGKLIAKSFGLTEAAYRKSLSQLRAKIEIIENNLREQDYTFDYSKQPSKAMYMYRKAFLRNDKDRYSAFLDGVERGDFKINVGTLLPYEIIRPAFDGRVSSDDRRSMNITWKAQTDFTKGENALVVVDGSGSMYQSINPRPIAVALSLGIYFAEHNKGAFQNHFITFSANPQMVEIKGEDIFAKVQYAASFNEVANTNIQKVFELILSTALKYKVSQRKMPSCIYIISDMEFDACAQGADITNFEYAKQQFARHRYTLPNVVFWNVASRNQQQPVTMNEQGVALVSGASPKVFSMISSGNLSPYGLMLDTLSNERYNDIRA
jgi:hypothetical protein